MTNDDRIDHDGYFKRMHKFPATIAGLVQLIREKVDGAPAVPHDLDFDRTDWLPDHYFDENLKQLANDMVCRVPFRDSDDRFLWMAIMLEFQSDRQYLMALRIWRYAAALYDALAARRPEYRLGKAKFPPLLPIVVYNGEQPWEAPTRVSELVAGADAEPAPWIYGASYVSVDLVRLAGESLPADNVMSMIARLEAARTGPEFDAVVTDASVLMARPDLPALRPTFSNRARLMYREATGRSMKLGVEEMERIARTGEPTTRLGRYVQASIREAVEAATAKATAKAVAEKDAAAKAAKAAAAKAAKAAAAKATGKAVAESLETQRALLGRLAARKFGEPGAARLAVALAGINSSETLADIAEGLFDCETVDELIDRVGSLA